MYLYEVHWRWKDSSKPVKEQIWKVDAESESHARKIFQDQFPQCEAILVTRGKITEHGKD